MAGGDGSPSVVHRIGQGAAAGIANAAGRTVPAGWVSGLRSAVFFPASDTAVTCDWQCEQERPPSWHGAGFSP